MSFISNVVTVAQTVYAGFFAWMPSSLQVLFGGTMLICCVILVLRIIAAVLNAIPFL